VSQPHNLKSRMSRVDLFSFHVCLSLAISGLPAAAQVSVWTSHNDNARTGLYSNETILTRTNVNRDGFGRLFSQPVDGVIYAQPLYEPNVTIPNKGTHNVVYVATMHDSVYAFDADTNAGSNAPPLWKTSFINPAARITAPTPGDASNPPSQPDCSTFYWEIGIVGTPVIDESSGTLFVVARTKEPLPPPNSQILVQVQRLHALDITTGAERSNSPVVINASVPGTGDGSSGGMVSFNAMREVQRSSLLLAGGVVYISWASYCDFDPYHGWIIGYDAKTLNQVAVLNNTPNGNRGGIWMGQAGPAAAPDGTIYCITGNGSFDTTGTPQNFGDSFIKMTPGSLTVTDYFTPYNQANLASADEDLGSGGAMLLPDSVGSAAHPHLVVGCGKEGKIYLVDRDNMGHFNPSGDTQIVQNVLLGGTVFGAPAFFNNQIYYQGVGLPLRAYAISNAVINTTPVSQTVDTVPFRGATPCISANGTNNGIAWELVPTSTFGVSSLVAYNADNLNQKLYDSHANWLAGAPDRITLVKFAVPTIANGKVFAVCTNEIAVFGLRSMIWSITRDTNSGSIKIVFSGPDDRTNILQYSSDLAHWNDLGPGTPTGTGTFSYSEPISATIPTRFYRVKPF